jgi:hypothetical protein
LKPNQGGQSGGDIRSHNMNKSPDNRDALRMALKIGNVSRIQLFLGRGDLPATGFGALLPAGYNLKSVGNTVNIRFLVSI